MKLLIQFVAAANGFELVASRSKEQCIDLRRTAIGRILKILEKQEKSNELADWKNKLSMPKELED